MKYSITILQAEIARFENGIKHDMKLIAKTKREKGSYKALEKQIPKYKEYITELKADIKKL